MSPTLLPSFDRAMARFTASVVFPTPPLPDPIATMDFTPGIEVGGGGAGWPCAIAESFWRICAPGWRTLGFDRRGGFEFRHVPASRFGLADLAAPSGVFEAALLVLAVQL